MAIEIKSRSELGYMREAARVVVDTLDRLCEAAQPGVTLEELDRLAADCLQRAGATSSFLGYHGYPKVLCASVNEVVVHGIPNGRKLREGDIVGLDFGAMLKGFHADSARTVLVGRVEPKVAQLVEATRTALDKAIAVCRPGARIGDIGATVQGHVEPLGYSVVRDFVGHGIGRRMHEDPPVPNYGRAGTGPRLRPGMVLAIEPMVNEGSWDVEVLEDNWTAVTVDGRLSAHFEHTVLIGEDGPEVLTRY